MSTLDARKNFAIAETSTGYSDIATSIVLETGAGAAFPDPATAGAYNVVWWNFTDYPNPADDPNVEIARVTAKTSDTLTISRAQEGTSASTKNTTGKVYKVMVALTAKMITDIETGLDNRYTESEVDTLLNLKISTTAIGVAGGVASLDGGGKVPSSQLPLLALTDVFVVASQAAQLALTAQEGDVAIRTDLNKSFIHNGGVAGTMADWSELLTPTDAVLSVNGMTGAVTIGAAGSNTHVQFNDSGSFGGNSKLTFNKTSGQLSVNGGIGVTGSIVTSLGYNMPRGARFVLSSDDDGFDYIAVSNGSDGWDIDTMIFGTNSNFSGKNKWVWVNGEDGGLSAALVGSKFGIGVSEPLYQLHIVANQPEIYLYDTTEGVAWRMVNNGGLGTLVYGSATVMETDGSSSVSYSTPGATGTMAFYQNNIARIHIGSNGNVGINTTSNDRALEVNLGTGNSFRLSYNDNNGSAATHLDTTLSSVGVVGFTAAGSAPQFAFSHDIIGPAAGFKIIGGTGTTADLWLQTTTGVGASGADMHFLVGNNGATEAMTILNSGFVGVNTNAPVARFQVSNGASAAQDVARFGYSTSVYMKMVQGSNGLVDLTVVGGGSPMFRFNNWAIFSTGIQVASVSNDNGLAADLYKPGVPDKVNCSNVEITYGQYLRVGATVTYSSKFVCTTDNTGTVLMYFELPISAFIANKEQLAGCGTVTLNDGVTPVNVPVKVYGDHAIYQSYGIIEFDAPSGGLDCEGFFHFTYFVI